MGEPKTIREGVPSELNVIVYNYHMENNPKIFWKFIKENSHEFSNSIVQNTDHIIQMFIMHLVEDISVETIILNDGADIAILSWDPYDLDTILALRYRGKNFFEIYFQYYNNDYARLVETIYSLSNKEIKSLPSGITRLLKEKIALGKAQRSDPNMISF